MALKKGSSEDLRTILAKTPSIPDSCQWCTFLRNHDELTLEMVTPADRLWMWEQYAPEQRMRLNLGIRRRLAPLLDNDIRKIKLINSLLFTLPGSPILYYGDEIGMGDNVWLPDRNGVRTPMQWTSGTNAGFSDAPAGSLYSPVIESEPFDPSHVNVAAEQTDPSSLWSAIRHMLHVRKAHRAFGRGDLTWVEAGDDRIASFRRQYGESRILAVHNLSDAPVTFSSAMDEAAPLSDLLTGKVFAPGGKTLALQLAPYEYLWLKAD